mgnify:CR=1 FL=1
MKRNIKGYIISVVLILVLIISVVAGYKYGYLDDIFRKDTTNIIKNGSNTKVTSSTEEINKDEVTLLNKGDSYILEYDSKKITGKENPNADYSYKIEYIDSCVSRELPSGMSIDYYKQEEKERLGADYSFDSGYYYVMVEVNMTNLKQDIKKVAPTGISIGNFIDGKYKNINGETRGMSTDSMSAKGVVQIECQQKQNIKLCYIVPDEYVDENLVVKYEIIYKNKYNGEVPYLVISK